MIDEKCFGERKKKYRSKFKEEESNNRIKGRKNHQKIKLNLGVFGGFWRNE